LPNHSRHHGITHTDCHRIEMHCRAEGL